ncbi:MAG: MerR family transcriptional regulator [Candidatus Cloacimonetes bacterium]|nr:MerR family transcriptional regulator [Candidatus Cloacimonadota bacterium]
MRILKRTIIRISKNSKTLFQFRDQQLGCYHFANSAFPDPDPDKIVNKQALILELGGKYYLLGHDEILKEKYIEYHAGDQLTLRLYPNGNAAMFFLKSGSSGVSVLNYDVKTKKLIFDASILNVPYQSLHPSYIVCEEGRYTSIQVLLPTTVFAALSSISKETLRRWKVEGKLIPVIITSTGRSYYSPVQCSLAKKLHDKRCNSAEIYLIIINELKELNPGEVVYISWFKNLVRKYSNSNYCYSTLRDLLRELISQNRIERVKQGYYCSFTNQV